MVKVFSNTLYTMLLVQLPFFPWKICLVQISALHKKLYVGVRFYKISPNAGLTAGNQYYILGEILLSLKCNFYGNQIICKLDCSAFGEVCSLAALFLSISTEQNVKNGTLPKASVTYLPTIRNQGNLS